MRALLTNSKSLLIVLTLASTLFFGFMASGQDPTITVRFSNPEYVCATQTYSLDVEFQSDTPDKEISMMNVRFFYDDNILEFVSFGEFVFNYGVTSPNPAQKTTGTAASGMQLFGFTGPEEWLNGGVKKNTTNPKIFISTTGWTKLFCVNFHVDDPSVMNDSSFCPSVIWDKKENPAEGGIGSPGGVLFSVVTTFPGSANAIENVSQFNWDYDGIPGDPHGYPEETDCISTLSSYAPKTYLPVCGLDEPGAFNIPVTVTNFNNIGSFSLVFEYDTTVVDYLGNTPNAIFTSQNGLLNVTDSLSAAGKRKIKMTFQGVSPISLADSSSLVNLSFNYFAGSTMTSWLTDGTNCYYTGPNNSPRCDLPKSDFYLCGAVISMLAPITKIDSVVAIEGGYATFSIKVWDFIDIHSGSLTLNFSPGVLSFDEVIPNAAIDDNFTVTDTIPGMVNFSWTGSDTSLADGIILMYVTFQYFGGSSPLTWFDNGSSCQYTHCQLSDPLTDAPSETFYLPGNVTNSVFEWSGDNSGEWSNPSNWSNNTIPDQFTDVSIDPSADPSYWPTFSGDFTLGENCKNLTLNGNAQMTVNGDLNINPGHVLELIGTCTLQVSGNWINSGIFIPGTGIIEFTGTDDITIDEGVSPVNYVSAYLRSTFTAGMVPLVGGVAGPSGDDAHTDANIGFDFNYLGNTYSQARLNTNGWLSLNLSGADASSSDNTTLFNTSTPSTALAPWWDDLQADASTTISYLTEGMTPSRVFIAEWKNILSFSSGATTRLNFQVKLYETSGIIEFCYGSLAGGTHNESESASIGIKDATGGQGNYIEATQNTTYIALAVLKSNIDWPEVNYRFTPPVEYDMDIFYKVIVSKPSGNLNIARDVKIIGFD
jgi:hypothetical protein